MGPTVSRVNGWKELGTDEFVLESGEEREEREERDDRVDAVHSGSFGGSIGVKPQHNLSAFSAAVRPSHVRKEKIVGAPSQLVEWVKMNN